MSFGRGVLFVASVGGLALLVRSLVLGPVPLWLAGLAFVAYAALVLVGVFFPQIEMFAPVLWRGRSDHAEIALTFDDGPNPETTPRVLDSLAASDVTATFFVIGRKVEAHPDVLTRIVECGHEVGIQGYAHDRFLSLRAPKRIVEDLRKAIDAVEHVTGARPTLFRPPVGHVSPRTETAARELGLTLVGWSVRGLDGIKSAQPKKVVARVAHRLRPGSIVLLHDASEHDQYVPAGVEALPGILDAIHERGLRVVALSQFLRQRFGNETPDEL